MNLYSFKLLNLESSFLYSNLYFFDVRTPSFNKSVVTPTLLSFNSSDNKSNDKVALDTVIMGILQGIIAWGISIGINQTGKQLKKDE